MKLRELVRKEFGSIKVHQINLMCLIATISEFPLWSSIGFSVHQGSVYQNSCLGLAKLVAGVHTSEYSW